MKYTCALSVIFLLFICVWPLQLETAISKTANQPLPSCCGANCLYILFHMLGKNVKLSDILEHKIVSQNSRNLSLLGLKKVSADFGYEMDPIQISCDKLVNLKLPFIAHIAQNPAKQVDGHFVVGWSKNSVEVEIIDYPRREAVPWEKLNEHFTGYALIVSTEKNAVLLPESANSNDEKEYPALPKFTWISENNIDAGSLFEGKASISSYEFCFQNTGSKTLLIKDFVSSCSCVEAKLSTHSIPPSSLSNLIM